MRENALEFDTAVIGAGPGGYVAAIRAAQLGQKVCVIDEWRNQGRPAPGGTCTNVGCIPSKALLASSCLFEEIQTQAATHGIAVNAPKMDVAVMIGRKDAIVRQSNEGIQYLFRKNKIAYFCGRASFVMNSDQGSLLKTTDPNCPRLFAKNVILATGSKPRTLPNAPFDEQKILSNQGALNLPRVPSSMVVIGAGVIGLEIGSVWSRLGAKVHVLEAAPSLLAMADEAISKEALRIFEKQGLKMEFGVRINEIHDEGARVAIKYTTSDASSQEVWCEKLLVCIGRVPNTDSIEGANVGLKLDERGFIEVDANCQTNLPGVWAIGDAVRGPMLAHKAEEEGKAVAERIAGHHAFVDFNLIPSVIYTEPEIAWVGKTSQQLRSEGIPFSAGQFPFSANGRARAVGQTSGFVRVLAGANDEILGVHIIGGGASELIGQALAAMAFGASSEDLGLLCQAHPSFSEAIKEAALAVNKEAINL